MISSLKDDKFAKKKNPGSCSDLRGGLTNLLRLIFFLYPKLIFVQFFFLLQKSTQWRFLDFLLLLIRDQKVAEKLFFAKNQQKGTIGSDDNKFVKMAKTSPFYFASFC